MTFNYSFQQLSLCLADNHSRETLNFKLPNAEWWQHFHIPFLLCSQHYFEFNVLSVRLVFRGKLEYYIRDFEKQSRSECRKWQDCFLNSRPVPSPDFPHQTMELWRSEHPEPEGPCGYSTVRGKHPQKAVQYEPKRWHPRLANTRATDLQNRTQKKTRIAAGIFSLESALRLRRRCRDDRRWYRCRVNETKDSGPCKDRWAPKSREVTWCLCQYSTILVREQWRTEFGMQTEAHLLTTGKPESPLQTATTSVGQFISRNLSAPETRCAIYRSWNISCIFMSFCCIFLR